MFDGGLGIHSYKRGGLASQEKLVSKGEGGVIGVSTYPLHLTSRVTNSGFVGANQIYLFLFSS